MHAINERIRAREVRVVVEGVEPGIYPIDKALEIAREAGLDLVEISPNAEPPVCKVVDYKKFLYDQKKKQKEIFLFYLPILGKRNSLCFISGSPLVLLFFF